MKCSELLRELRKAGWFIERQGKGSHLILAHKTKEGKIVFPNHGSKEMPKGTEKVIKRMAGIK
ncbi:MAG: type II toxin-antitoxin system HicA family toxin [Bacteroidetes bacterium]|nr:type II toxin-antitoxin system HicA family toxin [Bacteroidota bacterium]